MAVPANPSNAGGNQLATPVYEVWYSSPGGGGGKLLEPRESANDLALHVWRSGLVGWFLGYPWRMSWRTWDDRQIPGLPVPTLLSKPQTGGRYNLTQQSRVTGQPSGIDFSSYGGLGTPGVGGLSFTPPDVF